MQFVKAFFTASLIALSTAAVAGTKTNTDTVINDTIQMASGSLSSARSSADTLQFVFCELYASTGVIGCRARNSAGVLRTCSTTDATFVKTVQMINNSSYVSFWWDASGNCTNILVRNGSNYLP